MDLKEALGAQSAASVLRISVYFPDQDRDGEPVPQIERWIETGITLG
ncbi:MAG: hypothetical protein ACFBQW_04900 [Sphingomonadaceae bacterium]